MTPKSDVLQNHTNCESQLRCAKTELSKTLLCNHAAPKVKNTVHSLPVLECSCTTQTPNCSKVRALGRTGEPLEISVGIRSVACLSNATPSQYVRQISQRVRRKCSVEHLLRLSTVRQYRNPLRGVQVLSDGINSALALHLHCLSTLLEFVIGDVA